MMLLAPVACVCDDEGVSARAATVKDEVQSSTTVCLYGEIFTMGGTDAVYVSIIGGTTKECSDFLTGPRPMYQIGRWYDYVGGLQPNSHYYYRAIAEYPGPKYYKGLVKEFDTPP